MSPHATFPWNYKYRHTFGDLVVFMSRSRNLSLMGRIILKQYIREQAPSKWEYTNKGQVKAYERPLTPLLFREKDIWKHFYKWRTPHLLLKDVSIFCAACGEDTEETAADDINLMRLFTGKNIYCPRCKYKVSFETEEAALDGIDDYCEQQRVKEILILAKRLSPRQITPRFFK